MRRQCHLVIAFAFLLALPAWPQESAGAGQAGKSAPIYNVTVIARTVRAVNYRYRSDPTQIDFRGTVLLPLAKGEAVVQSKAGRTIIEAKFQHLTEPERFGSGYLTYVLWAITPDGRATNLGEIVTDSKDNGRLSVTTGFQAFGLMVSAEPFFAVTQPSDLIVLENAVRSDTTGGVEQVHANYQLLPRGQYTLNIGSPANQPNTPMVSQHEYDALLAVYEASNAVEIARSAEADVYAPGVFQKAGQLLNQAQNYHSHRAGTKLVITTAREAAQRAEDARLIAVRQKADRQALAQTLSSSSQ